MSIQYKNAGFYLTTTNLTTCLTMDAGSRALIQNIQCANTSTGAVIMQSKFLDNSASTTYQISIESLNPGATTNLASGVLVLEESDALKIQCAATANVATGVISYALINRTDENG
ncbi:MAG: hypothetical protein QGH26_03990 [Candidatus Pacebacteria bacterium]|jgi:hypothetical protein|nr:hypothetical protein [Candidatus Paceibacterota bacterium]